MFGLEMKGMRGAELRDTAQRYLTLVGLKRLRQPPPVSAFRRHAAARRHRARARDRSEGAADGRAVRRARCADARDPAGRTDRHPCAHAQDHPVRHPRSRRGRAARRPRGGDAARPRAGDHATCRCRARAAISARCAARAEFAETRYHIWRAALRTTVHCMVDIAAQQHCNADAWRQPTRAYRAGSSRRRCSASCLLGIFRPRHQSGVRLLSERDCARPSSNSCATASSAPRCSRACGRSCVGYGLAIVVGVPLGLVIGRFRVLEAALGIYVTAGYAMPLVALVPLLILWLGPRLHGEGRGRIPDVGVPDLHQHLARRAPPCRRR